MPTWSGPFPVIYKNEASLGPHCLILEQLVRKKYIFGEYVRTELDPDAQDQVGLAQKAYPEHDWATLAVWAWGGMRVVDYLLTLDSVDRKRIAFTGHSRGGKTALLAAALDERIAVVIPNGSGAGGAGSYRVQGKNAESLDAITDPKRFSYWFHPRRRTFVGQENRLPFDQHFLAALVAPRALLATEASGDLWANPSGTQQIYLATKEVYRFLKAGSKIGLHVREGEHNQSVEDCRLCWILSSCSSLVASDRAVAGWIDCLFRRPRELSAGALHPLPMLLKIQEKKNVRAVEDGRVRAEIWWTEFFKMVATRRIQIPLRKV